MRNNRYTKAPIVDVVASRSVIHLNKRHKKLLPSAGQRRNMISTAKELARKAGPALMAWKLRQMAIKQRALELENFEKQVRLDEAEGINGDLLNEVEQGKVKLNKVTSDNQELQRIIDESAEANSKKDSIESKKKKSNDDDDDSSAGSGGVGVVASKSGQRLFYLALEPSSKKSSISLHVVVAVLFITIPVLGALLPFPMIVEPLVPFITTLFVHLDLLLSAPKQIIFDLMLSPIPEQEAFCGINNVIACSPDKVTWLSSELINFDSGFWDHSPLRLQNNRDLIVVTLFLLISSMVFSIFLALKAYYANVTMELLFGKEDKTPLSLLPVASAVAIFSALVITLLLSTCFNQTMDLGDLHNHLVLSKKRVLDLESLVLTYEYQLNALRANANSLQGVLDFSILKNKEELACLQETVDLSILKNGEELARLQETVDSLLQEKR